MKPRKSKTYLIISSSHLGISDDILKIFGNEVVGGCTGMLSAELLKKHGMPDEAKEVRRYRDVDGGREIVAVVFEHPSFGEVQPGAAIPEVTASAETIPESVVQENKVAESPKRKAKK